MPSDNLTPPHVRREIRRRLSERDVTQSMIAREAEVSKQMVHRVITGQSTSARVRELICKIIGWEQWPEESNGEGAR